MRKVLYVLTLILFSAKIFSQNLLWPKAQPVNVTGNVKFSPSGSETDIFTILPNPANGKIVISCTSQGERNPCTLCVRNALGQVVYSEFLKETSGTFVKEIDMANAPKGMYFVELHNECSAPGKENTREIRKVILQ